MRLIDADELAHEMYVKVFIEGSETQVWNSGCWIRYRLFEKFLNHAPTIEAEPVKQGKWVDIYGWVHCSVCHQEPPNESNIESDYCPNCGARMDKKV